MTMNRYEAAVRATQGVLDACLTAETRQRRGSRWHEDIALAIVDRLVADEVIPIDPEELLAWWATQT